MTDTFHNSFKPVSVAGPDYLLCSVWDASGLQKDELSKSMFIFDQTPMSQQCVVGEQVSDSLPGNIDIVITDDKGPSSYSDLFLLQSF